MVFRRRAKREPIVHPEAERVVFVRADADAVVVRAQEYSKLTSPKAAGEQSVGVAVAGEWVALRLPPRVHPWQLHNLAVWMLDTPGADRSSVIAASNGGPAPSYRLVPDPESDDWLTGWDDSGAGWSVSVPGHELTRSEAAPGVGPVSLPPGFGPEGGAVVRPQVSVRFEDPGEDLNPALEQEKGATSRKALRSLIASKHGSGDFPLT